MKVAFGLVGFLVVIGVIVWIMSSSTLPHTQQVLQTRKEITPKVQQMAGKDETGVDARTTISLDGETSGGRMTSVIVTKIDEEGTLAKYFGLKRGDSITEIAPSGGAMMPVKDMGDAASAKDQLLTAFQNSQQIVVVRDGQKLILPAAPAAGAKPGAAQPTGTGNALQKQLQGIQVPTH